MDDPLPEPLPDADPELAQLADVVWAERTVTERLAFKLRELELVLEADLRRYVGRCLDEVDEAWDRLEEAEGRRTAALEALGARWGRPPSSLRLRDLVADAPEPWATVFADHLDHLRALVAGLARTSARNTRLCAATLAQVDDDLRALGGAVRPPLRLVVGHGAAR